MTTIEKRYLQTKGALSPPAIIGTIKNYLNTSSLENIYKQYVLESSGAVVQKFTDIILAYQYDGRYHIVAQMIYQFKTALAFEVQKQQNNRLVADNILTAWVPICDLLIDSDKHANPELKYAVKHLQLELAAPGSLPA